MTGVIELPRNSIVQGLEKRLNDVLRRQYQENTRRRKIERRIWGVEQGLPFAIEEYGKERQATKPEAQAILRRDLYEVTAELMRLRCLRGHLRYAVRMAKQGDAYRLNELLRDIDEM